MSLKNSINAATSQAFRVADSVLTDGVYVESVTSTYDPTTGQIVDVTVNHTVKIAFSSFKDTETLTGVTSGSNQFPQLIQPQDKKATIERRLFPSTFEPKTTDRVTEGSPPRVWNVVSSKEEPTMSLIILQLRQA